MCKSHNIDHINQKVYLTASFLRAASRLGTPEYNELLALRRELPDYEFKKAESNRKKTTNKNKNLTYANMREHIKAVYGETQKAAEMLKKMERVEALSRIQANPYKYVHDWFINEFPNYNSAATEYNFEELSTTSQANLSGAAI